MNGWTRLDTVSDWDAYKATTAERLRAGLNVAWGAGPAAYPCLAASTLAADTQLPGRVRVLTAFVLEADARALLGMQDAVAAGGPPVKLEDGGDDTEFRRYVAANILAIVHELREIKITTAGRYEGIFNRFLAEVDRASVSRATTISPAAIFARGDNDS